jgi:hypothetical protein
MWLFSAAVSFMALGMWKGIEWYYTKDLEEAQAIEITAHDLAVLYEQDSTLATYSYSGDTVILTGVVIDIRESSDHYTVVLDGNIYNIDLVFSDTDEINKLINISTGETIAIKGIISGFSILTIQVIDCYFE